MKDQKYTNLNLFALKSARVDTRYSKAQSTNSLLQIEGQEQCTTQVQMTYENFTQNAFDILTIVSKYC